MWGRNHADTIFKSGRSEQEARRKEAFHLLCDGAKCSHSFWRKEDLEGRLCATDYGATCLPS